MIIIFLSDLIKFSYRFDVNFLCTVDKVNNVFNVRLHSIFYNPVAASLYLFHQFSEFVISKSKCFNGHNSSNN